MYVQALHQFKVCVMGSEFGEMFTMPTVTAIAQAHPTRMPCIILVIIYKMATIL